MKNSSRSEGYKFFKIPQSKDQKKKKKKKRKRKSLLVLGRSSLDSAMHDQW
jgi:hypothetical protein